MSTLINKRNVFLFIAQSIVCLFIIGACTPAKSPVANSPCISICLDSLVEKNIFENNTHKCRFVKLETTDDCLISAILKIEFDEGKIFIKDANQKIFAFDEEGKYLNAIGKIGGGADELRNMFDFYLDKEKQTVNILDIYQATIFQYDYSGTLLNKLPFEKEKKVFMHTSYIHLLDYEHLLLSQYNSRESLFNYRVLDIHTGEWTDYVPHIATGEMVLAAEKSNVAQTNQSTYMCAFLSDTIYQYNHNTKNIIPRWVFKGKLKPAAKNDFIKNDFEIALDAIPIANRKNLSTGIKNLYTTHKFVYFLYSEDKATYRVLFDRSTKSGFYYKLTLTTHPLVSLNNLIAATDNSLVGVLPVEEVLSENFDDHAALKNILEHSPEDDNPILVFYDLSSFMPGVY